MAKTNEKKSKKVRKVNRLIPQKPKRANNAFGAFLKEYWPSIAPEDRNRSSMKAAANRWAKLTKAQKDKYYRKVQADQIRYAKEMQSWKDKRSFFTRPPTAFALFVKDTYERERNNKRTIGEMGKMAAKEWHALSAARKTAYEERANRCKRNYQVSIRDYVSGHPVDFGRKLDTMEEYVSHEATDEDAQDSEMDEDEGEWSDEEFDED